MSNNIVKSDKKIKALKLFKTGKYTISDISRKVDQPRATVHEWIQKSINDIKELPPDQRIKIWQSESVKDLHLASIARDSLQEMLETNNTSISPDTKRAILHSASVVAGIKWDKSRLEAGLSTGKIELDAVLLGVHARIFKDDKPKTIQHIDKDAIDV